MAQISIQSACFVLFIFISITSLAVSKSIDNKKWSENGELLQVHVLMRHGARTPLSSYDTDPYKDYEYPEGPGGLTQKGKVKAYDYGVVLRKRYREFLSDFLPRNARAQSSPSRRVVDTALCFVAGLFPPLPSQMWSNESELGQKWQPIAVEMASEETAYVVGETGPCPVASKIQATSNSLPSVQKLLADHSDLLSKLSLLTKKDLTTWSDVAGLYDTLFTEMDYFGDEYTKPDWQDNNTMDTLKLFREKGFALTAEFPKPFLRLKAGPFLVELLSNLNKTAKEKNQLILAENKQFFVYSTHDTVLSFILHAMGYFIEQPRYCSGLVIELRSNPLSTLSPPMVHLYYSNVTDSPLIYELPLNTLPTFSSLCTDKICTFDNFAASLQNAGLLPQNVGQECGVVKSNVYNVFASCVMFQMFILVFMFLSYDF